MMLFPLYTHVRVPTGVLIYHARYSNRLTEDGKLQVDLTIPVLEEGFDGVVVKTIDRGSIMEMDLRPTGDHTKIENPDTEETYMFLDKMIEGKVTRL
jgi:hypothetical protein